MRIVTWNVNSIRSRHQRVMAWIEQHQPDVVALQETKCADSMWLERFDDDYRRQGYEVAHHGHNHWNGVALLSKVGLADIRRGLPGVNRPPYDEARSVSADCGGIDIHSVYVPNGRELDDPHYLYKLVWLERVRSLVNHDRPSILIGDFNVAPADADVYDPKRWARRTHTSPPERAAIATLVDDGLADVTRDHLPDDVVFTWWGYRFDQFALNRGLRVDLALCTSDIADRVERVWVDVDERGAEHPDEKPSDHAPLVVDLV